MSRSVKEEKAQQSLKFRGRNRVKKKGRDVMKKKKKEFQSIEKLCRQLKREGKEHVTVE